MKNIKKKKKFQVKNIFIIAKRKKTNIKILIIKTIVYIQLVMIMKMRASAVQKLFNKLLLISLIKLAITNFKIK
jgi:hypothetical protein